MLECSARADYSDLQASVSVGFSFSNGDSIEVFYFFKTGFLNVAVDVLELAL